VLATLFPTGTGKSFGIERARRRKLDYLQISRKLAK
jgi:hypothetical protein